MSSIVEALMASSDRAVVNRNGRRVTFQPRGDSEQSLKLFQPIAERLINSDGEGYTIDSKPHRTRDHAVAYVDCVSVQIDE